MNNLAEDTVTSSIFNKEFNVIYYKKCEVQIKAESINAAELQAQKVIDKLCSKDSETDPVTGMLHSIHEAQD